MNQLFCFGLGFTGQSLAQACLAQTRLAEGWQVAGTCWSEEKAERLRQQNIAAVVYRGGAFSQEVLAALAGASHVLVAVPPGNEGNEGNEDGGIAEAFSTISKTCRRQMIWLGYLSTVGVYGDRAGGVVDESSSLSPSTERSRRRVATERRWQDLGNGFNIPMMIFRLAGIYGPGRNQIESVKRGTARRIVKRAQIFNRIHVEDIVQVLQASMAAPRAGAIYNVCDDEPCPPQDVVGFAAELLGVAPPPLLAFEEADMSEMGRSFYDESKRVDNQLIKRELGVKLRYPTYREGLRALLEP